MRESKARKRNRPKKPVITMPKTKSFLQQFLQSPDNKRYYEQEKLVVDVTELLTNAMEARGVSRAQLAARLGKSKAFVTQLLRGRHNMTLRTLADLFLAIDCRVELSTTEISDVSVEVADWHFTDRWSFWAQGDSAAQQLQRPECSVAAYRTGRLPIELQVMEAA